MPSAVNSWVSPIGIANDAGLTTIDTMLAGVIVNEVEPVMAPSVAVIVAFPTATEVAKALELTVATPAVFEFQRTEAVKSCAVPSVNVPVAENCWVVPRAIEGFEGLTLIETSVAAPIESVAEP